MRWRDDLQGLYVLINEDIIKMKIKFENLTSVDSQPIPLTSAPRRNGDHAVISYLNMRKQELNISVTKEELESIDFSQDGKYMKLPDFLQWIKGSKGPYLTHVSTSNTTTTSTDIKW